jgi:phytoene dehydrogenase-like protein
VRAIVIGSGHNGLVCAAMLARAGHDVEVLEASPTLGGATRTGEIVPGYRTSVASYSISLFRPDVWADLGLGERIQLIRKEPAVSVPYPDGRWLSLRADADRTRASIAAIHAPDADAFVEWNRFVEDAATRLRPLIDATDPPTAADAERALGPDLWGLCVAGSAAETASAFFASDELRGLIASQGIVGTARSVDDPGTAWILAYHFLGGEVVGETGAWAYVVGGTGAIASEIADVAREAGARIRLGARVSHVLIDDGRAHGVTLEDDTTIDADIVVSNAHPRTTFALAGDAPARIEAWDSSSRTFKVNLAMRALPVFSKDPDGDACRGTLSFTWGIEHLRACHRDATFRTSSDPWLEVFIGSSVDPGLVDGDGATLSAFCQYAGPAFDPDSAAHTVIASLDRAAPGLADAVVGIQCLGPLDLEREIGLVGGNIFHGELAPPQIFDGRFPARSGIAGLYLCGSGTHPGGAITGAPGRNAALAVLADAARR